MINPSFSSPGRRLLELTLYAGVLTAVVLSSCKPAPRNPPPASGNPPPAPAKGANDEIHLNDRQILLGNIQLDTISSGTIGDKLVLTGTLNFNLQRLSTVSTRVEGRVETLYVKKTGDFVHKGDKLYDLYSEPLNSAKQEYKTALQQQKTIGNSLINYAAIVESARTKLLLWGMTRAQIVDLETAARVPTVTTFYSPEDGYVTAVNIQEGGYAMEGVPIIQLADLSTLWAEAQVYTTQLASMSKGQRVVVRVPDLGDLTIPGRIDFINPEINPDTRIDLVRVTVRNTDNRLHPGMPVYIVSGETRHHAITIPTNAVLTDSKGTTVWVQTRPGVFVVRMVLTGITSEDSTEIVSGLAPGDVVVSSGAYLINSEYIFENGTNAMEGMKM
ncbi:MAG: efflux RND transporter periplasmic adaptor subunit [Bacteroidota bacterium]|nr:efflux RND transporter periplasmic adaptor subunit [Bacteroidota bacterium]